MKKKKLNKKELSQYKKTLLIIIVVLIVFLGIFLGSTLGDWFYSFTN